MAVDTMNNKEATVPLLESSRRFFSREFRVQGSSMDPLIPPGSHVKVCPFLWGSPRRNDIVALRAPGTPQRIELKRVIGLPGERVSWIGMDVWINEVKLEEPYVIQYTSVPGDERQ